MLQESDGIQMKINRWHRRPVQSKQEELLAQASLVQQEQSPILVANTTSCPIQVVEETQLCIPLLLGEHRNLPANTIQRYHGIRKPS